MKLVIKPFDTVRGHRLQKVYMEFDYIQMRRIFENKKSLENFIEYLSTEVYHSLNIRIKPKQ